MAMIKKHIDVTKQQDEWLQAQIDAGLYQDDSQLIQAAIAEKQARMAEEEKIRKRLVEAEKSGFTDLNLDQIWLEARQNGQL